MMAILQIGTASEYVAGTAYDLYDTSQDNIYLRANGRMDQRFQQDGTWLHQMSVTIRASSILGEVEAQESLLEKIHTAMKYRDDPSYAYPVYLFDSADTAPVSDEFVRRAVIVRGSLVPSGRTWSLGYLYCDYTLFLYCLHWESRHHKEPISSQTFDGTESSMYYDQTTNLEGDKDSRISRLRIRSGGENNETDPIYQIFLGIRPKYYGLDDKLLVWNWEEADPDTFDADTSVGSVNDGNTYPNGSSSGNCIVTNFGTESNKKRATLKLEDVQTASLGNVLTNPGAEDGDMTGWDHGTGGFSASSDPDHIFSGSYGFYQNITSGAGTSYCSYQDESCSPGNIISLRGYGKAHTITDNTATRGTLSIQFLDSSDNVIETPLAWYWFNSDVGSGWRRVQGSAVAPEDTAKVRLIMCCSTAVGDDCEMSFDTFRMTVSTQADMVGRYVPLLRCKVGSGTTVAGYLTYGYTASTTLKELSTPRKFTNTDWMVFPMGVISIPPGRQSDAYKAIKRMSNLGFNLYLERLDGSGSFTADAILLVPYKYYLSLNKISICKRRYPQGDDGDYADLNVYRYETGEITILAESTDFTGVNSSIEPTIANWKVPVKENFFIVYVGQRETIHQISDSVEIDLDYYPAVDFRNSIPDPNP